MTPAEKQRRSFAYGNLAIENPSVTKEMVDEQASNPASPYWQPGRAGDGILRKIEPNDRLPGVWAGNKRGNKR